MKLTLSITAERSARNALPVTNPAADAITTFRNQSGELIALNVAVAATTAKEAEDDFEVNQEAIGSNRFN
jgi:hypothetical protein